MLFLLLSRCSVTRLSHSAPPKSEHSRHFLGLARLSLGLLLISMLGGCIIEDPPPYTEPKRTPPRLDLRQAAPLIDQVIVTRSGDNVAFNVPVASEDAGDPIQGILFLDLNLGNENALLKAKGIAFLDPSTLDDTMREPWSLEWQVDPGLSGCHRLTLVVTHLSNFGDNYKVKDKTDQAIAVWWANVNAPDPQTLVQCPLAGGGN